MTLTVTAAHAVTQTGVIDDARLSIEDGIITAISSDPRSTDGDIHGAWVLPGAVDLHCHGGAGASVMSSDLDEVRTALGFHRRHGTTSSLISLVSAPLDQLCRQLERIARWMDDPANDVASHVMGIHLEGPFLSTIRCGAIDPATMIDASPEAVDRLIAAATGRLRVITVAPERPGVLDAIATFRRAGVVVAVGHTDATAEVVRTAFDAGARMATHLGNAMRPFHHRDPGAFGAALVHDSVSCELVADGHHLHPDTVRIVIRAKGSDRVTLCTDAVAAAGAPDGRYDWGGRPVTVSDGIVRLDATGALAGSTLTMGTAVTNALRWGIAPEVVAKATSTNPARLIGLDDRGVIAVGGRADLAVFEADGSLTGVVAAGEVV